MQKSHDRQVPIRSIFIVIIIIIFFIFSFKLILGSDWEEINLDLPPKTTSHDIIPEKISGYTKVETNKLISKATSMGVSLAVVYTSEDIIKAYKAAKITDSLIQCYQNAGALDSSGFLKKDNPILGGVIIVGDKNQVKDPKLLYNCIKEIPQKFTVMGTGYRPCVERYVINTKYNSFYVFIAGTDIEVCKIIRENVIIRS